MATEPALLAAAIRRSLSQIYALSDQELCDRDARLVAFFHAVARESTFSRRGAAAFEALARLILGSPLPSS